VRAEHLVVAPEIEVVRDRGPIGETANEGDETHQAAKQSDDNALLDRFGCLVAVCIEEPVGGAKQAFSEDLLDLADLVALRVRDVIPGTGVEALAGLDSHDLDSFGVVAVEANVFLELEALLLHEAERSARASVRIRKTELVLVDDRSEALA
jgi:hypothetical protein